MGDMVMSQVLFKCLKQNNPNCTIDVLAPAWSLPILERMPEVNAGITLPFDHGELRLSDRYQFGKQLSGQYDHAIVLPNSLKSALIPFHAGIEKRTGWRGEMRYVLLDDIRLLNKKKYPLMIERFAALAFPPGQALPEQLPKPALTTNTQLQDKIQGRLSLQTQRPVLALCPGAEFGNAKQWPEEYYGEVAGRQIEAGWDVWILGSANDNDVADRIYNSLNATQQAHCQQLAGKTALIETVDLLAAAAAVITNDSGLMHIAAAVNTPLVVIYGSTSPDFTPPLAEKVNIHKSSITCAPCFKRTCPLGHRRCLTEQKPEQIITSLERLVAHS